MPEVPSNLFGPSGLTSSTSKLLPKREPPYPSQYQSQIVKEKLCTRKFANQESITIEDSVKEILPIWLKPCKETLTVLEFRGYTLMRNIDNFLNNSSTNLKNIIFTNVTLLGSDLENSKMKLFLKKKTLANLRQISINGEGQLSVHELNVLDNLSQNYDTSVQNLIFAHRINNKKRKGGGNILAVSKLIDSNVLINFLMKNCSSLRTLDIDRVPLNIYTENTDKASIAKIQLESFSSKGTGFRRFLTLQYLLKSLSLIITEQDQDLFALLIRNCCKTLKKVELVLKYSKNLKNDQKGKRPSLSVYHDCDIYEPAEELELLSLTLSEPKDVIPGRLINCQKLPKSLKKIILRCNDFEKEPNDLFKKELPSFLHLETLCIAKVNTNSFHHPFIVTYELVQCLLSLPKIHEFLLLDCEIEAEHMERIRVLFEVHHSLSVKSVTPNSCVFRR